MKRVPLLEELDNSPKVLVNPTTKLETKEQIQYWLDKVDVKTTQSTMI